MILEIFQKVNCMKSLEEYESGSRLQLYQKVLKIFV